MFPSWLARFQLLHRVTQSAYEALEHQDYPYDLLIRLNRTGTSNGLPFLDVIYAFHNNSDLHPQAVGESPPEGSNNCGRALDFSFSFVKNPLALVVADQDQAGISLTLEYNSRLFSGTTIEGYLNTLGRFARRIAAQSP